MRRSLLECLQQLGHGMVRLKGMSQLKFQVQIVTVAAAFPRASDDAGLYKIAENALHGALGDTHMQSEMAHRGRRVAGKANKNVSVVGQKRPPS